ncbi:MAG: exodeoxyribonuclease VII large subunit [Eubacterium sp.]|nr:exodeoxyribonuclease VII large subunit [Eubacterium sp.]
MNINALTVTQVNTYIKAILDENVHLKNIYIVGEISNFLHYFRSGHMYFTLKDENSQLKAVMFSSNASRLKFKPNDGMKVLCRGRISVYDKDGNYQLYVDDMQPDGIGTLAIAFEQLKEKLSKEGLFDEVYKKPVPKFPRKIGVATSDMGAAVEDIKNITKRRYPIAELVIVPTVVQGDSAPDDICKSIKILDCRDDIDVIIVGRGGGSLEDLWAFNTEQVARAVFECNTPIISAVGHETDYTICDFVSDLRAPTPSAAAELAVPDSSALISYLDDIKNRLSSLLYNKIDKEYQKLDNLLINTPLENMNDYINQKSDDLEVLQTRLFDGFSYLLEQKSNDLKNKISRLDALSPLKILLRGYTLTSIDGKTVGDVNDIKVGDVIDVTFTNGKSKCIVKEVTPNE